MHKIKLTAKQCQQARALLKWNLGDLVRRTNVYLDRIRSFEKGLCQLHRWENDELVTAFLDNGVEFLDNLEVTANAKQRIPGKLGTEEAQDAPATIHITGEMLEELTGENEKEKRRKKETESTPE